MSHYAQTGAAFSQQEHFSAAKSLWSRDRQGAESPHVLHVHKVANALGDEISGRRVQACADLILQKAGNFSKCSSAFTML